MAEDIFRAGLIADDRLEEIRDAAAVLQLHRSRVATRLQHGKTAEAAVIGVGHGINEWMLSAALGWRENLSVRPNANPAGLRVSIPNNRAAVANGQRMVSVFDQFIPPASKLLLAGETSPSYFLSVVPTQMKIINEEFVLL